MTRNNKHIEFSNKHLQEGVESPFAVPKDYFETLSANIIENAKQEIPSVSGINANSVFTVPDGYFEELPSKIQGRINHNSKKLYLTKQNLFVKLIAASILLLLVAGTVFYLLPNQSPATNQLYVEDYFDYSEVDEFLLIEALKQQENATTEDSTSIKQLENYLLNNYDYHQILMNL